MMIRKSYTAYDPVYVSDTGNIEEEEEEFELFWRWHGEAKRPFLTLALVRRFLAIQKEVNEEEIHLINHEL